MRSSKLSLAAFIAVLSFFFVTRSFAQTNPQDTLPYKAYEVGLFGTVGASVFNGTVPDGSKTDIYFPAYTIGALGTIAANRDIGFALGLGYEQRGMFFKQQNVTTPNETIAIKYLSFQPSIRFKSFLLGINFNIPMSANVHFVPGSGIAEFDRSVGTDTTNSLIDIRAEGLLPIVENDFGNLYFVIQASYCLSDAIGKGGFYSVGQTTTTPITKSPIPTVQIGLSYLFSPGAKTK